MGVLSTIGSWWNDITGQTARQQAEQDFNAKQAELQRSYEAAEAQKQRDYEERMSNTAIQRQKADAESAGVNSAMLFANSSSSGASTPVGSSARGSAASASSGSPGTGPIGGIVGLVNSAANLTRAFNSDKNKSNDVTFREVTNTVRKLEKLLK